MVVVLAQVKGGVGKSTLAVNFAVERSRAGRDVLLVDADEQVTVSDFTALRTSAHPAILPLHSPAPPCEHRCSR